MPADAAASTDGAALLVATATITRTRETDRKREQLVHRPGHTGDADFVAHGHMLTITLKPSFRATETPDQGVARPAGLMWSHATRRRIRTKPEGLGKRTAEKIMESGSTDGTDMKGKPVILLTTSAPRAASSVRPR